MTSRGAELLNLYDRNQDATLYVGNVDTLVDEELLWEFFVQVGVVKNVHIPRDKVTGHHQGYGFVEFETEEDADYAVRVLNFIKLYNKPLKLNKAAKEKQPLEVSKLACMHPTMPQIGANLFVGNLNDQVDEKILTDAFASFGNVTCLKVIRDVAAQEGEGGGEHKTYAFISYDNFESSDAALAAMNGQFFCNQPIHVSYAYKKDTKGQRHGSAAERLIAANRPQDYSQAAASTYAMQYQHVNLPLVAQPVPGMPAFNSGPSTRPSQNQHFTTNAMHTLAQAHAPPPPP